MDELVPSQFDSFPDPLLMRLLGLPLLVLARSAGAYYKRVVAGSTPVSCRMPPKRKSARAADIAAKKARLEEPALNVKLEWHHHGRGEKDVPQLVFLDGPDALHSTKAAGFDIDCTVIKTKSGRRFPTGPSDWQFLYECVPAKLKELHDSGIKVVFFTNQAGVEKQKVSIKELCTKFEAILNEVGIPIQVFMCTGNSHYRKPSVEMWRFMETQCNGGVKIERGESLYVGDAAGRAKNWSPGKPKDFSSSDRMFASNLGVQFHTPEAFFLGEAEAVFDWHALNPRAFLENMAGHQLPDRLHSDSQEMVVVVGRPASGKSSLRDHYFTPHGYVAVNRDTLGTQEKCLKMAAESLGEGKSVIVDNTNPSKSVRKPYIDLAKKNSVPVRCFYLDVSPELANHLNYYRQNMSKGAMRRVPMVGYRVYEKNFEHPDVSEGFAEVKTVQFMPHFDTKADRELFQHWNSVE